MVAFLYSYNGEFLGVLNTKHEGPPPQMIIEFGKQFVLRGSEARVHEDEIEWLGWDYEEQGIQKSLTERQLKVEYNRELLVSVLVYHYRKNISSCGCGWAELGRSWPEHVANVYEFSLIEKDD